MKMKTERERERDRNRDRKVRIVEKLKRKEIRVISWLSG